MASPFDIRRVFRDEYAYVRRSLERLGVPATDVDDLCQEVFLMVHAKQTEYDEARPLRPWLFGFAMRLAANHRRLARRRFEVPESPNAAAREPDPEVAVSEAQDKSTLLLGLGAIDFDRRVVVVMHDLDGHDAPSIARELAIPVNTVYSRLREGRKDLAAQVRRLRRSR